MKKIFTLLVILSVALSASSQETLEILFLQDVLPPSQARFGYLETLLEETFEFNVELGALADAPTEGYDLAIIFEGIGSGSENQKRYNTTPMPLLVMKGYNVRSTGLGWTADPGTWDNNSNAIIIEMIDHPIFTDLPYFEDLENGEEVIIAEDMEGGVSWVPSVMGEVAGVDILAVNANVDVPDQLSLLAIEPGTTLNGVQLVNRAVIFPLNIIVISSETTQEYEVKLSESALKILENACLWLAGVELTGVESHHSSARASLYPNPSSGMVKMKLDQAVSNLSVKVSGIDGRTILSKQYSNTSFEQLDLTGLHAGMYFISLEGPDISFTERLIIK